MVSLMPEFGAPVTGVQRFDAALESTGTENVYKLNVNGIAIDLTDFTVGKRSALGRGVLAYTIEGMATNAAIASDSSIEYANRIHSSTRALNRPLTAILTSTLAMRFIRQAYPKAKAAC